MQLTLYLLRDGTQRADPIVRERSRFRLLSLGPIEGINEARLSVRSSAANEPRWLSYLFALTFGRGFQAVNSEDVQPGFGLRVAANSVAADRIIGGDLVGHGKGARNRRSVLPEANGTLSAWN